MYDVLYLLLSMCDLDSIIPPLYKDVTV